MCIILTKDRQDPKIFMYGLIYIFVLEMFANTQGFTIYIIF